MRRFSSLAFLMAQHHGGALFPSIEELGDHFRRVLEVCHDPDDRVARGLIKRVQRRAYVAKVPGVHDYADIGIGGRNPFQDLHGAIARAVVDENVLVAVASHRCHHIANAGVQLLDILFLVETTSYDADGFHADVAGVTFPFLRRGVDSKLYYSKLYYNGGTSISDTPVLQFSSGCELDEKSNYD